MRPLPFRIALPLMTALATAVSVLLIAGPLVYKIYDLARREAQQAVHFQAERVASALTHGVIVVANRAMDLSHNVDFQAAVAGGASAHTAAGYLQEFNSHNKDVRAAFVFRPDATEASTAWPALVSPPRLPEAWTQVASHLESWRPYRSSYQVLLLKDAAYLSDLNRSLWGANARLHARPRPSPYLLAMLLPIGAPAAQPGAFLAFVLPLEEILQDHWHLAQPEGRVSLQVDGEDLLAEADGAAIIPRSDAWLVGEAKAPLTHVRDREHFAFGVAVAQPAAAYLAEVQETVAWVSLLVAALLLLAAAGAYAAAYLFVQPLGRLTAQAEAYSAGDYSPTAGRLPFVEWQTLQATMQSLGQKIERQVEQAAAAERRHGELTRAKVVADLGVLRDQMQPHFMFNVLNNIRVLIRDDGPRAAEMLSSLSDLYRLVVEASKHPLHPLAQELAVVDHYLALQGMRFEERLTYERSVPPELESILVPSLILQTLVENAVKHGIAKSRHGGKIWLSGVADAQGGCVLTICNSGAALSAAAAPGIGLSNTRRRLELFYGSGRGPELWTDADGRSCVRIHVAEKPT